MKHLVFIFTILFFISCSKNDDAIDFFLQCDQIDEDYKAYENELIDCQFHFVLTEYNNQQFIELRAHCADLTRPFVFDENCKDICERIPNEVNSVCENYLQGREEIKILFIQK